LNRLADVREAARFAAEVASIGPQSRSSQPSASKATETVVTTEELLRLIVAAVNASRPATQQSGDPGAPGRATMPNQPKSPPTWTDAFGHSLGSVLGSVIPSILPQPQSPLRPQPSAAAAAQSPGGVVSDTTAQPRFLRAGSMEKVPQPIFPAAPTDMALGE